MAIVELVDRPMSDSDIEGSAEGVTEE
jgi:hypothetical protein